MDQMSSTLSLTAVFEPVEEGWTQARIAEIPGVITAAPTLSEAKELLVDALREYLLALQKRDASPTTATEERSPVRIVVEAA